MRSFLLIESRSGLESPDVGAFFNLATSLLDAGHQVTLFLLQNAVLGLTEDVQLAGTMAKGAQTWVDRYSLEARGIDATRLAQGIKVGGPRQLVRMLMTPGVVPVWH
ncbi:MAG TPA: DsrE family protein [Candidatus Limnocylindrales bacterium]|nr:DsrE family protein [Candidatus Limnocylindrales bacterium]